MLVQKVDLKVELICFREKTDSLNNKFNPIPNLRTQAVLIADDDLVVDVRDIDYSFSIWKANPYSIVGNFPRFHRLVLLLLHLEDQSVIQVDPCTHIGFSTQPSGRDQAVLGLSQPRPLPR